MIFLETPYFELFPISPTLEVRKLFFKKKTISNNKLSQDGGSVSLWKILCYCMQFLVGIN